MPFIVGPAAHPVAEVVLLIGGGILFGPEVLGLITVDESISLLSELGLGMLFFVAGMELETRAVRGESGRLAAIGWGVSLADRGHRLARPGRRRARSQDTSASRSPSPRRPSARSCRSCATTRELNTRFGTLFMGAGAWGEFGPIIAISILLGTQRSSSRSSRLVAFGLVAVGIALVPKRLANQRVLALLEMGHSTSSQTAVRVTMLLLIALLTLAGSFGLDVVLGAFVAGIIVRRLAPPSEESKLTVRVEAIAFGFLVPLFFVVSGANLDIISIVENPGRLVLFFVLLLVVRGLPQFFLYRKAIPDARERGRFTLLVATGLPIIVAVTSLEVGAGIMDPRNAAALVGAGALSVLFFPLIGGRLVRGRPSPAPDQERAENTA